MVVLDTPIQTQKLVSVWLVVEPVVALAVLVVPMAILILALLLEGVAGPPGPKFLATSPAVAAVVMSAPLAVQLGERRLAHIALLAAQAVSEAVVQAKYNEY